MPVVTINGRTGTLMRAVGLDVARLLSADYVDYQIIAEAARRTGTSVEAVVLKDERAARGRERLARFFNNFLEKSAAAGSAGDPFLGPSGVEVLMNKSLTEAAQTPQTPAEQLNDSRFIQVLTSVIQDEAKTGNAVIIGRGGNIILKDLPNAVHVQLVAGEESRIAMIMARDKLSREAAVKFLKESDAGRENYYKKFFRARPEDPAYYHMYLNTDKLGEEHCARIIAEAAKEMERPVARVS
ncbi:MAG: cytidylate kinase-like family protein [Chloroflexi bacterium]|nr:cytidylate kinase-like family protein [Chloroflexota bacterium]